MAEFRVQLFSPRELRAVALIGLAAVVIALSAGLYLRGRPAPVAAAHPAPHATPVPARVLAYDFTSPTVGWIATGVGNSVRLMRTTNGGVTWTAAGSPLGLADGAQLKFFDARHGFAFLFRFGQQASVSAFATDDGGVHWRPLTLPAPPGLIGEATFADPQNGWLAVNGPYSDPFLRGNSGSGVATVPFSLSATHDGGRSWAEIVRVDSEQSASRAGLPWSGFKSGLVPSSPNEVWIQAQSEGHPAFYFSIDGGRSWQPAAIAPPAGGWRPRANYLLGSVAGNGGEVAAGVRLCEPVEVEGSAQPGLQIACNRSLLLLSADRGRSWSSRALPDGDAGPEGLSILDPRHWWMVAGGNLQFSSDGGLNWVYTPIVVPASLRLASVHFFDPRHGVAGASPTSQPFFTGGGARLFHTADGIHWTPIKLPLV